eukprot:scaffold8903_cov89-Skeletonema_marinoi.AAC.3
MQTNEEPVPAVLVLAQDVELIDCEIYGSSTIGLKTYEMNTRARRGSTNEEKNCVGSVICKSKMKKNALYGVESEESGLVEVIGRFELDNNKKGDVNENVVNPAKRARSTLGKTQPQSKSKPRNKISICVDSSSDDEVQIIDLPETLPTNKQKRPPAGALKSDDSNSIAIVTRKSRVKLPKKWPRSLYFSSDTNVNGWPGPDKLEEFYLTNPSTVNRNVVIEMSSKNRGHGLLAAKTLRKGQVVGYYSGLLRRQQVVHDSEYVAKWRPLGEDFDDVWEIDALWLWGGNRFANYPNKDETPNMKANCIRRNNLQVIAFKALMDIKKGTELLWDYGPDFDRGVVELFEVFHIKISLQKR